jgi:hypothetical protein
MTILKAPLTNHAWNHKLNDIITRWSTHSNIYFSSRWSFVWCASEPLMNSAIIHVIGIFKDHNMHLLWLSPIIIVANRWIEVSNGLCSSMENNPVVLDSRRIEI